MAEKIGLISLGCAKNLVDSEQMLSVLADAGYEFSDNLDDCAGVLVNTCGFIDDAKSEAIENFLELAQLKEEGKIRAIVAAGCLVERYREELRTEIPQIDALLGCGSYDRVAEAFAAAFRGEEYARFEALDAPVRETSRVPCTPPYTAYVRIGEGCDNRCSYCVIPSLRGPYRSRQPEAILQECRELAEAGAKELIIIAQDITKYGTDLGGDYLLPELLEDICRIEGPEWIRLHYLYPSGVTEALMDCIERNPKIVRYLDIPIQHISEKILSRMNRHHTGAEVRALFKTLKARFPDMVLRTSVMVGFPGETKKDFDELMDFLREFRLQRAGVFVFSPQEGTEAAGLDGKVSRRTAQRRAELVSELQAEIMEGESEKLVDKTLTVLCEGFDRFAEVFYGRTYADSPEVDGKVFFSAENKPAPGDFCRVSIQEVMDGDPLGVRVESEE
ncbi:MAG: 30S ribosomal protein S12 methylthiotransferase RimO [Clostridia bacterium]|nr:30S ribosomal protein S12 methylthiotransferase RimO [Clostridia bacterium]